MRLILAKKLRMLITTLLFRGVTIYHSALEQSALNPDLRGDSTLKSLPKHRTNTRNFNDKQLHSTPGFICRFHWDKSKIKSNLSLKNASSFFDNSSISIWWRFQSWRRSGCWMINSLLVVTGQQTPLHMAGLLCPELLI